MVQDRDRDYGLANSSLQDVHLADLKRLAGVHLTRLATSAGSTPDAPTEIRIEKPGMLPVTAVVPASSVTAELIQQLERQAADFPRLSLREGHGAVDIRLDDVEGAQVKSGTVVLEGPSGEVQVSLDPNSRRFRKEDLPAGQYRLRAASSGAGRGAQTIEVRSRDVTRCIVRLDGSTHAGSATLTVSVRGTPTSPLHVRATDKTTGLVAFEGDATVRDGLVTIDRMPFGALHVHFFDDSGAKGCYDVDATDGSAFSRLRAEVDLVPRLDQPDPPDDRFGGLSAEFNHLRHVLPELGIRSIHELAASEGEGLMHLAKVTPAVRNVPVSNSLMGSAIEEARSLIGIAPVSGEQRHELRLAGGASFRRAFLPRTEGQAEFSVELPSGSTGELVIEKASGVERHPLSGSRNVSIQITAQDIASGKPLQVSLANHSTAPMFGELAADLPVNKRIGEIVGRKPSTKENLERIYRALAQTNPGISTSVIESALVPENLQKWLDRARTFLAQAHVCSLNDLGTFRLDPARVLRPGLYVAPRRPPSGTASVVPLKHYAFSELLNGTVVHYRPNDIFHNTAVVMAGTWDITTKSPVIIGKEVREFVVIAKSITYNKGNKITWEQADLHQPFTYLPTQAFAGANGTVPGERGHDGGSGDLDPHPMRNGGANADTAAPFVTMYILDATIGLPEIDLRGQTGGIGGVGQDGGPGGNGAQGPNADSTTFGCCRAVGWGGDGGNGGSGGKGGQGGRGGQGGAITLLTSTASIGVLADQPPDIKVTPGEGGDGGPAGNPGGKGVSGPAGSADCQFWCPSHPERHGADGQVGVPGDTGRHGDPGPQALSDAIQIYPITAAQWDEVFNSPHILNVDKLDVEPGENVSITGENFLPGTDKIYFDGKRIPDDQGQVSTTSSAAFKVPVDSEGGAHPLVIHPVAGSGRRSNKVTLRVIPRLLPGQFDPEKRWTEGQVVTLNGLAFLPGCQVIAEDWSVNPKAAFNVPVTGTTTRTSLTVQVPPAPLGPMRGVRRIQVRNPDGGTSRPEKIIRIGDTIVVNVAAWRVLGKTPGVGTTRSVADITNLFTEGAPNSLSLMWQQARVVFRLVEPVGTLVAEDWDANQWPHLKNIPGADKAHDDLFFSGIQRSEKSKSALNFFFVKDINAASGYSYRGSGVVFCGLDSLNLSQFQHVAAHEAGHAMCLPHYCALPGDKVADTFLGRVCEGGDGINIMFADFPPGDQLLPPQIDTARGGAGHFEQGKTVLLLPAPGLSTCNFADQG